MKQKRFKKIKEREEDISIYILSIIPDFLFTTIYWVCFYYMFKTGQISSLWVMILSGILGIYTFLFLEKPIKEFPKLKTYYVEVKE